MFPVKDRSTRQPARIKPATRSVGVAVVVCVAGLNVGCGLLGAPGTQGELVRPVYSPDDDRLVRLDYDANADGQIDTWTYMDGSRVKRLETDTDSDSLVDRWEYYSRDGDLARVGSSSLRDGREDTWMVPAGPGDLIRVERSTQRNGIIDRWERFDDDLLVSTEEDTNGDGRVDRWETYQNGAVATLALDTSGHGWPDRRMVYRPDGQLDRLETDPDGDGTFVPLPASQPR